MDVVEKMGSGREKREVTLTCVGSAVVEWYLLGELLVVQWKVKLEGRDSYRWEQRILDIGGTVKEDVRCMLWRKRPCKNAIKACYEGANNHMA